MAKCGGCGRFLSSADGVKCSNCPTMFHGACVNMPSGASAKPDWICPGCKTKLPRGNNTSTPIKGVSDDFIPSPRISASDADKVVRRDATCQDLDASVAVPNDTVHNMTHELDLASEMRLFRDELHAMRAELREIRGELCAEVVELRQEVNDLKTSSIVHTEKIVTLEDQVQVLKHAVSQLQEEAAMREQRALQNDIEISGFPEQEGESPMHIVMAVARKLGLSLEDRDIVSARRVGARRETGGTGIGGGSSLGPVRPRPIAVSLLRRALRDDLLKSARVRGRVTTEQIIAPPHDPVRFYINERLTKANRVLLGKTREAAKVQNWSFLWTRDGRIFAKRDKASVPHNIRNEEDIAKLFPLQ